MDVALLGEIKELLSVYGGYKEYTARDVFYGRNEPKFVEDNINIRY